MHYLISEQDLSIQRSCICIGISRSTYYRPLATAERDSEVIEVLIGLVEQHPRWAGMRSTYRWNHKRVYRVYCKLGLNQKRRAKKRLPKKERIPLHTPEQSIQVWSADFMSDALYSGKRYRTFNIIDDFNREVLHIEIDTSLTSRRLIRVFEHLRQERGLPDTLRVDNGPEFLGSEFAAWAEENAMAIQYIQPGKPNQNAYIERFNRTYRNEVLDLYLFDSLEEVKEVKYWWMIDYNEKRPHDSLMDMPPAAYMVKNTENSGFNMCT